ncbi:T9SS type B sorting domain-containing protein, partial [Flavobacterium hercynium]
CTDEITHTVAALVNITITGQLINDVLCNGDSNGSVKFDVDNFATTYTSALIAGSATATLTQTGKEVFLTNAPAGTYTVRVTDAITGCFADASVTVGQPAPLGFSITNFQDATCNTGAQISVTASGGTPNYQYAFVLAGVTPTPADYTSNFNALLDPALGLNWSAYVKDANNCVNGFSFAIAVDPLPGNITANVLSHCPSATGTYTFTVNVGSGVGPFEYSIPGSGFQTSNTFVVNAPGSYDVTVRDANGCQVTIPALVTILPALQLNAIATALPTCTVVNGGSITATAAGGSGMANYSYSLNGGAAITTTPAVFNNVVAGSHIVRVTDTVTGCSVDVTVVVSSPTLITGFALAKTDVTCNGGSDGRITASLAPSAPGVNDNPVYQYSLTGTTVSGVAVTRPNQVSPDFDLLEAGTYTVTVTSGRACQDAITIQITEPALIVVATPVVVQYACNAGSNASNYATVTAATVTGGSGVYTYEFIRNGVAVQKGAQNLYTESDFLGGSYIVNVTDDKGCTAAATTAVTVNPFIGLDIINVVKVPITCVSNEEITVSVATTGGTPALLDYSVVGTNNPYNQANTTGVFTGLTIGNYMITVLNPVTGCSIQQAYYVADPNTFEIKANTIVKEICYGTSDGVVELTFVDNLPVPVDKSGPFDYTITDGVTTITGTTTSAGPITIANLSAGQYTVTATLIANPQCTVTTIFSITQPAAALALSTTSSAITCIPGTDGEITASASQGWGAPYEYELVLNGAVVVPYRTNGHFTGLGAGVYTINAKDSHGCVISTTETLVIPAPIVVIATVNTPMLSCFGDRTAVITVAPPTGGQGSNYLYTLNKTSVTPVIVSGPQSSAVFSGLGAGTYTITVTDGFNCSATSVDIVIAEPTVIRPYLIISKTQTCLTQSELTLSATGGNGPYTYSADGINYSTTTFASSVTFSVPVGNYQYYVKDANGCVAIISNGVSILPLQPLVVNLDLTNAIVKCNGNDSGVIVANATGGLGAYSYTLEDGAGNVLVAAQNTGRFEKLFVGTYVVKVTSVDCDASSALITITEPATKIQATFVPTAVTCFGENNGKIVVNASGGTGVIKYAISPKLNRFVYSNTFEKLAAGTYTVVAQDENGCYETTTVVVSQPNPIITIEVPGSMIPELCKGDKNGAFSIEVSGGTGPYSVSLDSEKGPYTPGANGQTVFDFNGIHGGTHIVYIRDAQNCTTEYTEKMPLPIVLEPKVTVSYECVNNAQANRVEVTIDESNTDPNLIKYDLDGNPATVQISNIFTNIAPGYHIITAVHNNGCYQFSKQFLVESYEPLTLAIDATKEMNVLTVKASGGAPKYEYSFNGEPFTTSNKYKIYQSGDYHVIVRDQNGCEATIIVPGLYVDVCLDDYFTPNGDGVYDGWGPGCTNIYNNLEFSIFDRYGRVIKHYHYGEKWDGRYNGEELPSGDYWYVLKLNDVKDNREFVGHFTLYR